MDGASTSVSGSRAEEFRWSAECDELLEKAAASDYVDYDWDKLRHILKYKLDANIKEYLADPPRQPPPSQPATSPEPSPSGGLKIAPFPQRPLYKTSSSRFGLNSLALQKSVLSEEEARDLKETIFSLIDDFGDKPPFTIQRICELARQPRKHYKTSGKYLRAVERSLLVTSTSEDFPVLPVEESSIASPVISYSPAGSLREATTPLFSPIPFLHEDARRSRSQSRSPPMSPLELASKRPRSPGGTPLAHVGSIDPLTLDAVAVDGAVVVDGPVIGLVDELDDPSPGHMSDHPTALSATTSSAPAERKPIFGTLEDRFVRSSTQDNDSGDEMLIDEADEDKENIKA